MSDIRENGLPLVFDETSAPRVGLVVLATDHTSEGDFQRMLAPAGITVHTARIPYANPTTPENLRRMQPDLSAGAALILPGESLDAICYSCTSASVVIGEAEVEAAVHAAKPDVPVVTPPLAAVRGLRALGAREISLLAPYTVETSRPMLAYFAAHGFAVRGLTCLGLDDDREMARLTAETLVEAAVAASAADALFIACTALRAAGIAARVEAVTGRPTVTANQATAWSCLRLCGDAHGRPEWGRLMTL